MGRGSRTRHVRIKADSELLVKQMRGEYKVKNAGLQPLAARARQLVAKLDSVSFEHVRREKNKDADRLSNVGMDEAEEALRNPARRQRPARAGRAVLVSLPGPRRAAPLRQPTP